MHQAIKAAALSALVLLCACTDKSQTMTRITPTSQQVVSIKWDEAVAAETTVKVNNTNLIFMR